MKKSLLSPSIACSILFSFMLSSCMTTKTSVGYFKESAGIEYTYDKGKQLWLFWGLVPIGRTDVSTPASGDCEIITKFRFTDVLISGLTAGFVTSYSIKVKAKRQEHSEVSN